MERRAGWTRDVLGGGVRSAVRRWRHLVLFAPDREEQGGATPARGLGGLT